MGRRPSPWRCSAGPCGPRRPFLSGAQWQGAGRRKSHRLPFLLSRHPDVTPQVSGSDGAPAAGRGA